MGPGETGALVERYERLVRGIHRAMCRRFGDLIDPEDLLSSGYVGLLDAAHRYRPSRGKFSTFATPRIRGAMIDSVRQADWLPRAVREDLSRLRAEAPERGQHLTARQLARKTGCTRGAAVAMATLLRTGSPLSLDDVAEQPAPSPDPVEVAAERDEVRRVFRAASALPPRMRQVVRLRFQRGFSYAEIGRRMGFTDSRASQLATTAISRLRRRLMRKRAPGGG